MFLTTKIDEANKRNMISSTLCIDVKGAFDNVFKKCLLQTMKKMRLDHKTTRWVESFLTDRMASLSFDKDTEQMSGIETGIPQGSPVSPILFLIYLSPLFTLMKQRHPNVCCPSYIDDICLLVEGESPAGKRNTTGRGSSHLLQLGHGKRRCLRRSEIRTHAFLQGKKGNHLTLYQSHPTERHSNQTL